MIEGYGWPKCLINIHTWSMNIYLRWMSRCNCSSWIYWILSCGSQNSKSPNNCCWSFVIFTAIPVIISNDFFYELCLNIRYTFNICKTLQSWRKYQKGFWAISVPNFQVPVIKMEILESSEGRNPGFLFHQPDLQSRVNQPRCFLITIWIYIFIHIQEFTLPLPLNPEQ